ncbi:YwqJ-related putative deaminase [Sessilibacter sp. MAH4]
MGIKSRRFENLQAKIPEFPGLQVDGKNFTIVDKDVFMSEVRVMFGQSNNPLNPMTEKLILNHIGSKSSFPTTAGIPGLHAEVQAANDVFNQIARKGIDVNTFDLSKVQVSTFRLAPDKTGGQGLAFDACSNCGSILSPPINILTGRKY